MYNFTSGRDIDNIVYLVHIWSVSAQGYEFDYMILTCLYDSLSLVYLYGC